MDDVEQVLNDQRKLGAATENTAYVTTRTIKAPELRSVAEGPQSCGGIPPGRQRKGVHELLAGRALTGAQQRSDHGPSRDTDRKLGSALRVRTKPSAPRFRHPRVRSPVAKSLSWRRRPVPRVGSSSSSSFGRACEPARKHDLLLIASRQRCDLLLPPANLDAKARDHRFRRPALLAPKHQPEARNGAQVGHDNVVTDRHVQEEALAAPILGDEAGVPIKLRRGDRGSSALARTKTEPRCRPDRDRQARAATLSDRNRADPIAPPPRRL